VKPFSGDESNGKSASISHRKQAIGEGSRLGRDLSSGSFALTIDAETTPQKVLDSIDTVVLSQKVVEQEQVYF
jgi:hypothetical protein